REPGGIAQIQNAAADVVQGPRRSPARATVSGRRGADSVRCGVAALARRRLWAYLNYAAVRQEMDSTRVTESEFQRAFGTVAEQGRRAPVTITKDGRDHLVVVSAEEFARLKRRDRQVGLAADLPEEWVEAVRQAKVPEEFSHLNSELD